MMMRTRPCDMRTRRGAPAMPWRLQSMLSVVMLCCLLQSPHGAMPVSAVGSSDDGGLTSSEVGVLPLVMTGELQPSRLTVQLLQHGRSSKDSAAAAEMLKSALELDDTAPLYNLFMAWSQRYKQLYTSAAQAEAAFVVFKASVDCLLHHNTHTTHSGKDGEGDDGDDGAWYALNAYSATPQSGGYFARSLQAFTSKPHKGLRTPPARPAAKPSRCPRSVHLKPPPPRPRLTPRLKPPPHGGQRPAPAIAPPRHVPPTVTDVPSPTPAAPPSPHQQPVPQPRPPANIGGPNSSQTVPAPPLPSSSGPLGPIYLAATLYRSGRVGGSPDLTFPPPPSVDWTTTGKLTPVKFQGSTCSSCWANAAVSAVEAALSIAYDTPPIAYSRQILVDCARLSVAGVNFVHDDGCHGGDAADALLFMNLYSIPTEDAYPYISDALGIAGTCNAAKMTLPASDTTWLKAGSIVTYPANSEVALQAAVAVQPVVIYWNMGYNFRSYGGGIYDSTDQTDPVYGCVTSADMSNHAMMAVGYDAASRLWIIQNSFGAGWGEQGFIRVRMTNDTVGPCGMYWYVVAPSFDFKRVPVGFMPGVPPPSPIVPPEVGCMSGVGIGGGLVRSIAATSMSACRAACLTNSLCTYVVWDGANGCQLKALPLGAGSDGEPFLPSVTALASPGGTCFLKAYEGTYNNIPGGTLLCNVQGQWTYPRVHGLTLNAAQTPPDLLLPEDDNNPTTLQTCQTFCSHNARCVFMMWASRVDGSASCGLYYDALTGESTFSRSASLATICFHTTPSN